MSCGNIAIGGCDNPDLGHNGPCTWDHETPKQHAKRVKRNKRKSDKRRAQRREQRIEAREQRLLGPARDSAQEIQVGLIRDNAVLTTRLAVAEKENAALASRLAVVEKLHSDWGGILSDGIYCPSEDCWAANGCDHTEGYQYAWHDLGKALNAK